MLKTYGRLRSKYGRKLENLELPEGFECNGTMNGWRFISEFRNLPKTITERFAMIYWDSTKS